MLWIHKYQLFIYDLTIELADMIKRDRPEANLQELFDLIPVKSEFELDWLQIDTLAFDKESGAYVIIEYKKGWQMGINTVILHWVPLLLAWDVSDADATASSSWTYKSSNSGLSAGELVPVSQIKFESLIIRAHTLYSSPLLTVILGNVATYSTMPPSPAAFTELI
jgi:hypothetical protein